MYRSNPGSGLCRRLVLLEEQLKLADERRSVVDEARRLRRDQRTARLRKVLGLTGPAADRGTADRSAN